MLLIELIRYRYKLYNIFDSLTIFARMNIFLIQRRLAPLFFKELEQWGKPTLD